MHPFRLALQMKKQELLHTISFSLPDKSYQFPVLSNFYQELLSLQYPQEDIRSLLIKMAQFWKNVDLLR